MLAGCRSKVSDPLAVMDDPCDEWPVFIFGGRLSKLIERDLPWLLTELGQVVSWQRIEETDSGDTLYRCQIVVPV